VETTETRLDGTIESAIASLIQPEEPEAEEAEYEEAEQEEEETEEPEAEDDSDEDEYEAEEDEEDYEEDEENSAPELYTVKVNGKEEQVSLEDLKRGYSGQQYVQKGMQEAANLRKQAEEAFNALMAERQQLNQFYQQVQSGQVAMPPKAPDKSMFESDPIGYMEAKMKYDEDVQAFEQQRAQLQQIMQQQTHAEKQAQQAFLQRELEQLKVAVPEFSDPNQASKLREQMLRTGQEVYGYTPEEIGMVMDHRALRVMRDAIKYQELMSGKQQAKKTKVAPKTRPVRAGAKKTDSNVKAVRERKSKLKRSGSIDDALGLILNA